MQPFLTLTMVLPEKKKRIKNAKHSQALGIHIT
jgi:hypothetical protein